jgi:hypothetical protein
MNEKITQPISLTLPTFQIFFCPAELFYSPTSGVVSSLSFQRTQREEKFATIKKIRNYNFWQKPYRRSCLQKLGFLWLSCRVARFFLLQTYRIGENIPKDHKLCISVGHTLPNGLKIFKMVIKYNNIFHSKALQILPKLGFLV